MGGVTPHIKEALEQDAKSKTSYIATSQIKDNQIKKMMIKMRK